MMKKAYESPDIFFEDFSLSSSIALNCERIVGNATQGTCALLGSGGVAVFTDAISACDFTPESLGQPGNDKWDGFCYHVPTEYNNLFNS